MLKNRYPVSADVRKTDFGQRSSAGEVARAAADSVDPEERVVARVALRVEARRLVLALRSSTSDGYHSLDILVN